MAHDGQFDVHAFMQQQRWQQGLQNLAQLVGQYGKRGAPPQIQGGGGLLDMFKMQELMSRQQERQETRERERTQQEAYDKLFQPPPGAVQSAMASSGGPTPDAAAQLDRSAPAYSMLPEAQPNQVELLKGLGREVGLPLMLKRAFNPKERFETVDNPYGRGGVGQQSSTTGQISGYQKPANESDGPFAGNALDAQDSNILLQGDPSSAEYGLSYYRQFQVPKMVMTEGGMVPMIIPAPPGIRPPAQAVTPPQGGAPAPIAGTPVVGTAKRPTDAQQKAASYGVRLQSSNKIISQYENLGAELSGYVSGSDYFPNVAKSDDRQKMEQAQRDFINAQLRRESGAVIADTEFDNAAQQYFPQPGDGPEVIAQKRQAREIAIANMGKEAGRAQRPAPTPPRVGANPQGGIPQFTNTQDPAFLALPSGSVFRDGKGILRYKP